MSHLRHLCAAGQRVQLYSRQRKARNTLHHCSWFSAGIAREICSPQPKPALELEACCGSCCGHLPILPPNHPPTRSAAAAARAPGMRRVIPDQVCHSRVVVAFTTWVYT